VHQRLTLTHSDAPKRRTKDSHSIFDPHLIVRPRMAQTQGMLAISVLVRVVLIHSVYANERAPVSATSLQESPVALFLPGCRYSSQQRLLRLLK
jgi:hypothetical protein